MRFSVVSIWVSLLGEAVTIDVRVLQIKYDEILQYQKELCE
jgi:hypothetical protein